MKLFGTNHILNSVVENPLKLETPLGDIVFKVKINEDYFNFLETVKSNGFDCYLSSWKSKNCEIDCLRTKFNPILPPDMLFCVYLENSSFRKFKYKFAMCLRNQFNRFS